MQRTAHLIRFGGVFMAVAVVLASTERAFAQTTQTNTQGTATASSTPGGLTAIAPIDRQASTTNFVGGSATENFVGGARQATQTQGQNRQFQAFQPSQTNQNSQSQQTGTPRQVRTSLRLAFTFPVATAAQQSGSLDSSNSVSLSRFASTRPELSGVSVNMTNTGEAVLTGTVVSAEASRLAANLVRLQPGVRKVNNQLGVTN